MTETEVRRMVRREVESICKREGGALPPTPYVVVEIIDRLRTLKPWEGLDASQPIGRAIRTLVEEAVNGVPRLPKAQPPQEDEDDPRLLPPLDAAKFHGVRKHRHLNTLPLRETG